MPGRFQLVQSCVDSHVVFMLTRPAFTSLPEIHQRNFRVAKRLQIEHAPAISRRAKLVKLADKICNLRDVAGSPPAEWEMARKQEYFDWGKVVVDGLRGVHPALEHLFDDAYKLRPGAKSRLS